MAVGVVARSWVDDVLDLGTAVALGSPEHGTVRGRIHGAHRLVEDGAGHGHVLLLLCQVGFFLEVAH